MKTLCLAAFGAALLALSTSVHSADLTPEMLNSLQNRLKQLKEKLDGTVSTRNTTSGGVFFEAAGDARKAVDLYLKCTEEVDFKRAGRESSEFREWRDANEDRMRDDQFIESLLLQLRYLAISCKAAETEKMNEIFPMLTAFVDSLSKMEELPTNNLTSGVSGSVFARAYNLEKHLESKGDWEDVPYNISGIYEQTIFPYLRAENPGSLLNAWDKRIEQQTRLVELIEEQRQKELRGLNYDETQKKRRNWRDQEGGKGGKGLRESSRAKYVEETLPSLRWAKLIDKFKYVDAVGGAQDMVSYIDENVKHPLAEKWYKELYTLIAGTVEPGISPEPSETSQTSSSE